MEHVGNYLKREREKQGVSLENIASITKIGIQTLKYIENNEFDKLPATPYVKGFLRSIAKVLDLEPGIVINKYSQNNETHSEKGSCESSSHNVQKIEKSVSENIQPDIMASANKSSKISFPDEDEDSSPSNESSLILKLPPSLLTNKNKIIFSALGLLGIILLFIFLFQNPGTKNKETKAASNNLKKNELANAESQVKPKNLNKNIEPPVVISSTPTNKAFSTLRLFARGRSWVKFQVDSLPVQTETFILGMSRSYNVKKEAKIFLGEPENVDVYFAGRKINTKKYTEKGFIVLKHNQKQKPALSRKRTKKISPVKINKDLVPTPDLSPERLSR